MAEFRVIDLRTDLITPEQKVEASSPEDAGRKVLGMDVFRSGQPKHLVARVYWQSPASPPNMVRLYSKTVFGQPGNDR